MFPTMARFSALLFTLVASASAFMPAPTHWAKVALRQAVKSEFKVTLQDLQGDVQVKT